MVRRAKGRSAPASAPKVPPSEQVLQPRDAGRWPIWHILQLVFFTMFLQPALLTLTLIDLARYVDASSFLGGLLHKISLILRPGDRLADRSAERLAWDMVLAVQGTALTQAWYCMRMHSWCHRAEGHERREPPSELKKRSLAVHTQIEGVVFSSFSLPLLWLLASVALVLVGAPLHTGYLGTATLAGYLALLGLWPMAHIFGAPPSPVWTRWLAAPSTALPREILVIVPCLCAWLGAGLSAAVLALDWGRAWQAWPVPCVYGAAVGVVIGHALALGLCIAQVYRDLRKSVHD
ncbi:GPI anchor biosynthesis protein [Malassezia pachydermatis]|uniref:Gpi-anchor biosynthesis protein (Pig-f) n=1 Tax=Malassezia pachydermatis TaxID=77020 RepID=A0A0M9VQ42_9BASI|nr:gpi-anchor biosynthesis protein (pig-f) [Malassezia pachydermatis]KOS15113.1 gpi-anchor biosynthesis protein (pig-f) [Malassezia pachydermatis]